MLLSKVMHGSTASKTSSAINKAITMS